MVDFRTMPERMTRHIIFAVLAAALIVSCKPRPFPKVDGGPNPLPEQPPPVVPDKAPAVQAGPGGAMTADIGDVQRGTWASHVFKIKNDLDRVMHVKNVRGS